MLTKMTGHDLPDRHIISSDASLRVALETLNSLSGEVMTLLVTDSGGRMVGTLTDGDVRRALLAGVTLDRPVESAMHRAFRSVRQESDPADIRRIRESGISLLPVLDADGRIVSVIDLRRQTTRLPVRAVLMAGGRGERLRPLTDSVPKPLLRVADRCIIDINIESLQRCGIEDITVTVRYLAEQIERHFSSTPVKCIREDEPLGTIGALSLLPAVDPQASTLLMNSDLFTSISFEEFYLRHIETGADITIATVPHTVSIPFAILSVDGDRVTGIEEKPTYTHYANAGIYLIRNSLVNDMPQHRLDAPDFIAGAIGAGAKVSSFPISGTWREIGTPADFRQACEVMRHHRNLSPL